MPATPPESTKRSLRSRLISHAHERWPDLADPAIRHRGQFAYVDGELRDGTTLPLFRLRYGGSANAWAPWLSMDHFAATQYGQVGSYHPSTNDLMAGDLVFWSGDGTVGGIGHVAMYIGGGNVIQAPQSGDVIKITNLFNVENGYYGATRSLT